MSPRQREPDPVSFTARYAHRPAESADRRTTEDAGEWQTILQLKQLFRRDPGIVGVLLADVPDTGAGYLATIATAAREAAYDGPTDVGLSFLAADALYRSGRLDDAEALLRDVVRLEAGHCDALLLLARLSADQHRAEAATSLLGAAQRAGASADSVRETTAYTSARRTRAERTDC